MIKISDFKGSCMVAYPRQCNSATLDDLNATLDETQVQLPALKDLAIRVLLRNSRRNSNATSLKTECNLPPNNGSQKLHGYPVEMQRLIETLHQHYKGSPQDWIDIIEIHGISTAVNGFHELVSRIPNL